MGLDEDDQTIGWQHRILSNFPPAGMNGEGKEGSEMALFGRAV